MDIERLEILIDKHKGEAIVSRTSMKGDWAYRFAEDYVESDSSG